MIEQYFYNFLWIPYLFILFRLYTQRSIGAPIILICVGLLGYRLPIGFGSIPDIALPGAAFCMVISLADFTIKPYSWGLSRNSHPLIWKATLIYFILMYISIFLSNIGNFQSTIFRSLDYSILFFVTLQCIKNERDIDTLLKGLVFGVFLMAAQGVIGYALDDPWWGMTIIGDDAKIQAKAATQLSYTMKLELETLLSRGIIRNYSVVRPRFSAGDPNSMATVMALVCPLLIYFWFKLKSNKYKTLISGVFFLLISSIFMSGSRSVIIGGSLAISTLFFILSRKKIISPHRCFRAIVAVSIILIFSFNIDVFGHATQVRIKQFNEENSFLDSGERLSKWKYHASKMNVSLLFIGIGQSGASKLGGSQMAHMNYLAIIYKGGFIAFVAFLMCLLTTMKTSLCTRDKLMGSCLFASFFLFAIVGIGQESNYAKGPPFVFWPMIAIVAKLHWLDLVSQHPKKLKNHKLPSRSKL